ncbi:IclR family transcriptional regulator [Rhodococcus fascians]|nr:IclR family transcriptional regulator [Rhodococcus fascians]MBY3998463.1 IclR family transcriptional regulator [Rhodococcus fascians]MBY4004542.1 IclR family transcriptional regulator [Rhodococcus fascians]MBY4009276.1 IclR family transcriptional regulator [Rhodococcus fascians]MBY4019749.1 IclR family transcriptional regulator [Rhodococcus fascians]
MAGAGRADTASKDDEPSSQATVVQGGTQTLIRGLRILEAMADLERPIGVGDLSRLLDLPKSTVQRLLRTLAQEGWAQTANNPVTRWELSPRLLAIVRSGPTDLREIALPHLNSLASKSGETIHLVVPDRDVQLVLIERVDSVHPIRSFNAIGASTLFHTSAGGKAVMSRLEDSEVEAMLRRPLAKVMPNTTVDPQQLMHQVLEARERGYAVNISENREHVCAVGSAVVDRAGRPIAAVVISMPDIRFEPIRLTEWGGWVRETAQAISREFGAS